MAVGVVQTANRVHIQETPTVCTFGSTTTTGNSIIVGVAFSRLTAFAAGDVTDSKSNTYLLAHSSIANACNCEAVWYCLNPTMGASHTVSFTKQGGFDAGVMGVAEVSGLGTGTVIDKTDTETTDATAPYEGMNTGTLASADQFAVACMQHDGAGNGTLGVPTGFTRIGGSGDGTSFWIGAVDYQVCTATTALAPSWSYTAANAAVGQIIVTFQAPSAAGFDVPLLQPSSQLNVYRM